MRLGELAKLVSLPDAQVKCIEQHPDRWFTVGKEYLIIRNIGNGVVAKANNDEYVILLKSRFEEQE